MIAAPASTRAMVRGRATALEGARIGVSPVSVSGSGAGSLVLTIRRTESGQIDDVDRILPANYLLLPRSGPPRRPGCVRPHGSRRCYETTSLHHRCPPGGTLDGAALRATAHRYDPRACHGRRDATADLRGHGRGGDPRRAHPGGRSV